jgi:hypothetical protein
MTKTKRQFLIFHNRNPKLWYWIDHFALERARGGWQHYGIKSVVEVARWHTAIPTEGDIFKIKNDFTAHYARMWMLKHPEYNGFFRTKHIPDDDLPDCDDYDQLKELEP